MAREVSSRESSNNKSNGAAARSSSISSKSKHGTLRLDELRARLPLSSEGRPSQLLEVVREHTRPRGVGLAPAMLLFLAPDFLRVSWCLHSRARETLEVVLAERLH